jgi:hypothetical protein
MQLGYTKFCCILCEWDRYTRISQYAVTEWPRCKQILPGQKNIANDRPIDPQKIAPPPLHIRLRLMTDFVKAMNWNGEGFHYLQQKFPWISNAKIKVGIFVGPWIKELLNDRNFDEVLEGTKRQCV